MILVTSKVKWMEDTEETKVVPQLVLGQASRWQSLTKRGNMDQIPGWTGNVMRSVWKMFSLEDVRDPRVTMYGYTRLTPTSYKSRLSLPLCLTQ